MFGKGAQIHQMGTDRQVDRQEEDKEYDSLIHASLESQAKIVRTHIYIHTHINTCLHIEMDFQRTLKESQSRKKDV